MTMIAVAILATVFTLVICPELCLVSSLLPFFGQHRQIVGSLTQNR